MVHTSASHYIRDVPSSELSVVLANPVSFRLQYFAIIGMGHFARDILAYSGAKWESDAVLPKNWAELKADTPFGCMPVLYVQGENGQNVHLSETAAVDAYLGRHFGLVGDNEYEATLISSFYSSSAMMMSYYATSVCWSMPEVKEKALAQFQSGAFVNWMKNHQKHLEDNGSNGHYIGSKMSIADIRTAGVIEYLAQQPAGEEFIARIKEEAPAVYKVREMVANHPNIAAWRATADYVRMEKNSKAFFACPFTAVLE